MGEVTISKLEPMYAPVPYPTAPDEPNINTALARPTVLGGMAVGLTAIVAAAINVLSHGAAIPYIPYSVTILSFILVAIFFGPMLFVARLRKPGLLEFNVGMFYPLSFITRALGVRIFSELTLLGIASASEGRGRYDLSAPANARFLREMAPMRRDSGVRREYGMALFYAGHRDEALAWAKQLVDYADALRLRLPVQTENSAAECAHAYFAAGRIYEIAGELGESEAVYEKLADAFGDSQKLVEASLFAMVARGKVSAFKDDWAMVRSVLQDFPQISSKNFFAQNSSALMSTGYTLLTTATAVGGDMQLAKLYRDNAMEHLSKDFATYARAAERELDLKLLGTPSDAAVVVAEPRVTNGGPALPAVVPTKPSRPLARRGRAAFCLWFVIGYVVFCHTTQLDLTIACAAVAAAIALIGLLRTKGRKLVDQAAIALSNSSPQEVLAITSTSDKLELFNSADGSPLGTYFANESLLSGIHTMLGVSRFRALIYMDAQNKPRAIECFGYYSVLSKSAQVPD